MPRSFVSLRRSVLLQRCTACLIWLVLAVKLAASLWLEASFALWWPWNAVTSLFSLKNWLYTIGLALLQAPILVAHSALVTPTETQPLQLPSGLSRIKRSSIILMLKWTPPSWLRGLHLNQSSAASQSPAGLWLWSSIPHIRFQHALGRVRGWKQITKAILLVLALTVSATLTIPFYQFVRGSSAGEPWQACA